MHVRVCVCVCACVRATLASGAHAALERGVLSPIPRAAAAVAHFWGEVSYRRGKKRERGYRRGIPEVNIGGVVTSLGGGSVHAPPQV